MSTATTPLPSLKFALTTLAPSSKFSPRLGQLTLTRPSEGTNIEIPTPGLLCASTRGVIQHLSRDNVQRTPCIRWVHVPFESFLQLDPPVPTRQHGSHPLHTFLGFPPARCILSMSLRDPADGRDMPPNGKLFVAAQSSRGSRKVVCPAYRSYASAVLPDIVFPLSDVPFTAPPHSQKRTSKSIERSAQWLATILAPLNLLPEESNPPTSGSSHPTDAPRLNVFLHMVGGIKPAARAAFSTALREPLEQKEQKLLSPLETLDEGVSGYVFDLLPLRTALSVDAASQSHAVSVYIRESFAPLIRASLQDLPATKPRLANTAHSPHEILALIRDAGVDLFDTFWAQRAAAWGVALDFRFPVPEAGTVKYDLGHNLYDDKYAHDFGRLADSGLRNSKQPSPDDACACPACSPVWENAPLVHSTVDARGTQQPEHAPPYTRAYLHHLLHTHEMSAHTMLVMHNITVVDAFMCGIRATLQDADSANVEAVFAMEVARFEQAYDAELRVLDAARECWAGVERARGKGRLAREREKKLAEELGVDVEVEVEVPAGGDAAS